MELPASPLQPTTTWGPTSTARTTTTEAQKKPPKQDEVEDEDDAVSGSQLTGQKCDPASKQFTHDPTNCNIFYHCSGVWLKKDCPAGLRYDKGARLCNHEKLVDCGTRASKERGEGKEYLLQKGWFYYILANLGTAIDSPFFSIRPDLGKLPG